MSQLRVILQGEREARTILRFLRGQMEDLDRERIRRRSFKERLGFKVMCCCVATWGLGSMMTVRDDNGDVEVEEDADQQQERIVENNSGQNHVSSSMNLAAALAAERHFSTAEETEEGNAEPSSDEADNADWLIRMPRTPLRVSLMTLLEEANVGEEEKGGDHDGGGGVEMGDESMCCVCMGMKKGAAFIPCGHTFCRVCSRKLWLNRGSCPLCNRSILEILDIF